MIVDSSYTITIGTLYDCLKILSPVFQLMRSKLKTNRILKVRLSPLFEQVTGNHLELWLVHRSALLLLWLVGVITLVFVWRQSFENHSVFIDNDFRLLKLVFAAFRTKRGVASSDKKWPKQGDKVNINYVFDGKN